MKNFRKDFGDYWNPKKWQFRGCFFFSFRGWCSASMFLGEWFASSKNHRPRGIPFFSWPLSLGRISIVGILAAVCPFCLPKTPGEGSLTKKLFQQTHQKKTCPKPLFFRDTMRCLKYSWLLCSSAPKNCIIGILTNIVHLPGGQQKSRPPSLESASVAFVPCEVWHNTNGFHKPWS